MDPLPEDENLIPTLLKWSEQNAGRLDQDVGIQFSRHSGYSFTAKTDLPSGTIVAESSYRMSLSYLNVIDVGEPFGALFERHGSPGFADGFRKSSNVSPKILGNFLLMQQYIMGESSFWWPYIQILPQPHEPERFGLPTLWPPSDQTFFHGTNIERGIQDKTELWNQDWSRGENELACYGFEDCSGPDCISHKAHDTSQYTRDLYRWAAAVFESRSFRPSETIQLTTGARLLEVQKHISEDNFAVLFPLIDMGNHNGYDRLEWLKKTTPIAGAASEPDPNTQHHEQRGTPSLRLRTLQSIPSHSEIYNFYGSKDNAELLLGYGFMLGRAFDRLNLKITAPAEILSLRRRQNCYCKTANAEEDFLFKLNLASQGHDILRPSRLPHNVLQTLWDITSLPPGLICTVSCLVANDLERSFLIAHPEYCIERASNLSDHFMGRNAIAALNVLRVKLEADLKRLETRPKLSENAQTPANDMVEVPANTNQEIALKYRSGQIDILAEIHDVVSSLMHSACKNTIFRRPNGHMYTPCKNANISCNSLSTVQVLSLETAYAWVELRYPDMHGWLVKEISKGQDDEPLPLNWANLIPDWDYSYWTVWIFLVLFLKTKEGELPLGKLNQWVLQMTMHWKELILQDPLSNRYYADQDEVELFEPLLEGIADQMPEDRVLTDRSEWTRNLGFFASFLAQETVRMPYMMLNALQEDNEILQRVLVV